MKEGSWTDSRPSAPLRLLEPSDPKTDANAERQRPLTFRPPRTGGHAQLLALLGDESPRVWRVVRRHLVAAGRVVRPGLSRKIKVGDARERSRARQVLLDQARRRAARRLAAYATRADIDLEQGFFLLGRVADPGLDARPYHRVLDAMGSEVAQRVEDPSNLDDVYQLATYLGEELGYAGAAQDYHHPTNVLLHRTIERKAGMPLTLCVLYHLVGRRAGLRTAFIPLPGHVLLRMYDANGHHVLIDPFHHGEVRTREECENYLMQHGLTYHPAWFVDATPGQMLRRQIGNLRASWKQRGLAFECRSLDLALAALEQNDTVPAPVEQRY